MSTCSEACFGSSSCNNLCKNCAATFALYSRARCSTYLFGDVTIWMDMDSQARSNFFVHASKKELNILRCFRNKSWKSGFQMFVSEFKVHGLGIAELSKRRSLAWREMPASQKKKYYNKAVVNKQLIKQYVKKHRRCLLGIFGKKIHKKSNRPLNSFMLFLRDRWTDARSGGSIDTYHQVRAEAVKQWHNNKEIQDTYASIYKESR